MHMFDYDDLEESGFIPLEAFVQRVSEFLSRIQVKGSTVLLRNISDHDLRFLGTKYMQRDSQMLVYYVGFLEDYDAIERQGLGGSANQLSMKDSYVRRDIALQHVQGQSAGSWRIKTIDELTPPESK